MILPEIRGIGTAVPDTCYVQEEILQLLRPYLNGNSRTEAIFRNAGIDSRHLEVAGEYYQQERTTQDRNERYMQAALPLGVKAIQRCLENAGMGIADVDDLIVVSCTGIDTPGLDLQIAGRLGMSPWLRRTTILGMGCYGAFPGLLRAREAAAAPRAAGGTGSALVLTVEICSLHFQPNDHSLENIVSSALFADGAAAALVTAGAVVNFGPRLVDSATFSDYQTFDHMAFHLTDHGFRMSLSAYVPRLLAASVETFVDTVLKRNGLRRTDVTYWAVHPGSSKILDYVQERLDLTAEQLASSRAVLARYGNMSSATVFFVLDEIQRKQQPAAGEYGMMMSFGPGLTMECALLRW